MTKQQFIQELGQCLLGEVDNREYNNSIQYYTSYIDEEVRNGKTEEEVTAALGSPRLIAKTIIDSQVGNAPYGNQSTYEETSTRREDSFQNSEEPRYRSWTVQTNLKWYEKVVAVILFVVFLIVILRVLGVALSVLWNVVLPVMVVIGLFRLIGNFFRH